MRHVSRGCSHVGASRFRRPHAGPRPRMASFARMHDAGHEAHGAQGPLLQPGRAAAAHLPAPRPLAPSSKNGTARPSTGVAASSFIQAEAGADEDGTAQTGMSSLLTAVSMEGMEDESRPSLNDMSTQVHSLILAGGASQSPLAVYRAVAAIPLGCTYRMVDVPISNCMRSGISKMYVLTQYMSASLNNHIATTYSPVPFGGQATRGWVEVLAATQTQACERMSTGSADAVRWHLQTIFDTSSGTPAPTDLLVLSGQALYNMDFRDLVALHRRNDADVTLATLSVGREEAQRLGIARINYATGQVVSFVEKPEKDILDQMAHTSAYATAEKPFEASMGIYVFKREVLESLLLGTDSFTQTGSQDVHFGRDVIPHALRAGYRIFAHHFTGYWRDVTRLSDYYKANLAFTASQSAFSPASLEAFMQSESKMLPPSVFSKSSVSSSLIGAGSWVIESEIKKSVLGQCASISSGCLIEDSIIMGNDFVQLDPRERGLDEAEQSELSHLGIREDCVIRGAIIDKNVCVGPGSRITNEFRVVESNRESDGFVIQDGIVTILKNAVLPPGTVI